MGEEALQTENLVLADGTVADTAFALRVLAGPDDRDPFSLAALGEKDTGPFYARNLRWGRSRSGARRLTPRWAGHSRGRSTSPASRRYRFRADGRRTDYSWDCNWWVGAAPTAVGTSPMP
jgi:hypothetical protein